MALLDIGAVRLTSLDDGSFPFPAGEFFAGVPEALWRAELQADADGKIMVGHNCGLVDAGRELILVDTGYGDDTHGGRTGHLLAELARAGVAPDDLSMVVNTHAHGDHAGRNTVGDGALQLAPGVALLPTPGHTPGHTSVQLSSGGRTALLLGDVCHHPLHVAHPDWTSRFDTDPSLTVHTRACLFALAEARNAVLLCPHAAAPGLGSIVRRGNGYAWEPLDRP